MFSKNILLLIAFILTGLNAYAQDCVLTINGSVFDEAPNTPLPYVNIFIQELARGTTSDEKGHFLLSNICPGHYHLTFSHIGCEGEQIHLDLSSDTIIIVRLSHTPSSLGTVIIDGKRESNDVNQPSLSVNRKSIEDNTNVNLAELLRDEAGVNLLKNGSGISKPVVHGLYGNRLIILNNGIAQSGQQWGNDHSPEIDPFASDRVTVLKGTSAIEYGGGNLGSAILVEPKPIEREPHLHGQVNYAFETNGRGHNLNTRVQKYSPFVAWRINGTLKKYGDRKSPNYYLNNTGIEEANLAIQLEKSWADKLFGELYISTFNTQLGVMRGSHIGNLTDLEIALVNDVPFFTEPDFSYQLDAPKQKVSHHLAKAKAKYYIKENQKLEVVVAGQINDRKEFDIRRGDRSGIPALSLTQFSLNLEWKYTHDFGNKLKLKIGNQNITTDNVNNPETGILPLIPDYFAWRSGLFSTVSKKFKKTNINFGIRYDYELQNVVTISNSIPKEIIRYQNQFHNISGLLAINFDISKAQSISINTGYAIRNPAINELFSAGLHQGVSGIEEGDVNLVSENAIKNTLEYKWSPDPNFSITTLLYHQNFNNYIFLNPQDQIRLTIRGAFPVFKYEQTDADIYGLDVSSQFTVGQSLFGILKYSYLKGTDSQNSRPLVFMPSNSLFGSLIYRAKNPIRILPNVKMVDLEFEINNRLVLRQDNLLPDQDFVSPPPTYNLLGIKVSTKIISSYSKIRCYVKAVNLFNIEYRDYLNRQRYFADDLGLSLVFGVNYKF